MGKVNVEIRAKSARLRFTLDGVIHRPTLRDDAGRPMPINAKTTLYAHKLAVEIKRKMDVGTFVLANYFPDQGESTGDLLSETLDIWFVTLRLAPSTLAGYSSAVRFWQHTLGEIPINTITLTDLLTVLAKYKDLSGKTVNNYVSVLSKALALAVKEGLLEKNVTDEIPTAKWQKPPVDPFSLDEVEQIVAYSRKHYHPMITNMIEAWFFTGLRTGEMFGLRWVSTDLTSSYIEISESTVMGEHKESTKTGVVRNVRLINRAGQAYFQQKLIRNQACEYVWLDPRTMTPWTDERAFRRNFWTPMLHELDIRYRRPYNCRHTYATMMLMAKRTPAWCAKQLGHSIEMFLSTYSKWIDGDQDDREIAGLESWLKEAA